MAYDTGSLDATLAAAAGDDPAMLLDLRKAFIESVARQIDLLERSRCDGNWRVAALRLKGLAASFHAEGLIPLAEQALSAAPGEPTAVRALKAYLADFATP
jgi:HPt (histidine-containing phosphotransfer) domain-containing protein